MPTYWSWRISQAWPIRASSCAELGWPVGFGVAESAPPSTDGTRRPTPIPTLNVSASASPMAARRIAGPRRRPAVGDPETWEGPGATAVASSGPGSMIGSVGIESGSIGGIVLVSC